MYCFTQVHDTSTPAEKIIILEFFQMCYALWMQT